MPPLRALSPNRKAQGSNSAGAGGKSASSSGFPAKIETRRLAGAPPCYSWAQRGADAYTVPHIYLSVYTALYQALEPMPASIRCVPDTIVFCAGGPTTWFAFDDRRRRVEPHAAQHTTAANIMMYFREVMRSRELLDLSRGVPDEFTRGLGPAASSAMPRSSGAPRFPCAVWIFDAVDVEAQDRGQEQEDHHVCVEYLDLSGVQALLDRLATGAQPPHGVLQEFVAVETPSQTGTAEEYLITLNALNPAGGAVAAAATAAQQPTQQAQPGRNRNGGGGDDGKAATMMNAGGGELSLTQQAEIFTKFSSTSVPLELTTLHKFRNLHVPRTDNLASVITAPGGGGSSPVATSAAALAKTTINTHSFVAIPPVALLSRTVGGLDADHHQCAVRESADTFQTVRNAAPGWSVTVGAPPLLPTASAASDVVALATSLLTSLSRDRDRYADALITPMTRCTLWLKPISEGNLLSSSSASMQQQQQQPVSFAFLGVTHIRMPAIRLDYRMIDEERIVLEGNANVAAAAERNAAAAAAAEEEQRRAQSRRAERQRNGGSAAARPRTPAGGASSARRQASSSPARRAVNNTTTSPPRASSPAPAVGAPRSRPSSGGGGLGMGVRRADIAGLQRQPPATVQQNVERLFERSPPRQQHQLQQHPHAEPGMRPVSATSRPPRPMSGLSTRPVTPAVEQQLHHYQQQQQQQQQPAAHSGLGAAGVMAASMHHQTQPQYPGGFHGNPAAAASSGFTSMPHPPRPQSATFQLHDVRLSNRTPTPTFDAQHLQQQQVQHPSVHPTFLDASQRHQPPHVPRPTSHNVAAAYNVATPQPNLHVGASRQHTPHNNHNGNNNMAHGASGLSASSPVVHYLPPEQQLQLQQLHQQQQANRIQYVYFPAVVERETVGQRAAAIVDPRPPSAVERPPEHLCPNCGTWCNSETAFPMSYYAIAVAAKHNMRRNERTLKHVFPRKGKNTSQRKAASIDEVRNSNSGDVLFADDFEWAPVPPVLQAIKLDVDGILEHGAVWKQRSVNLCEGCAARFWMPETMARLEAEQRERQQQQDQRSMRSQLLREIRGQDAIDLSLRAASPERGMGNGGATTMGGGGIDALAQQSRPLRPFSAAHSQTAARHALHEAPPVASCFSSVTDALVTTDLQAHHREIRQARRDKYAMRLVAADCHRGVDVFSANLAKQREIDTLLSTFVLPPQDGLGVDAQIDDPLSLVLSRQLHAAIVKVCKEPPELALGVVVSRPSRGKGPWQLPRPVVDPRTGEFSAAAAAAAEDGDDATGGPRAIGERRGGEDVFADDDTYGEEERELLRQLRGESRTGDPTLEMRHSGSSSDFFGAGARKKSGQRETEDERCARRNSARDKTYRALTSGSQTFAEMNENEREAIVKFLGDDEAAMMDDE